MKRVVLPVIFFLVVLVAIPRVSASSFLAEYPAENGAILSPLHMNGLMYSIGAWKGTMVILILHPNGSPERVILYKPPTGSLYPRASLEINGSIFVTGDYRAGSNGTNSRPFLMKISDGKVIWARVYSLTPENAGNELITTDIIPTGRGLTLLGETPDLKFALLEVSPNGTPVKGVLYNGSVGFFSLNGIATDRGLLLSGSTSKGWVFFMEVDENLTPRWVKAFNCPKSPTNTNLVRDDRGILAIVQSGNVLFMNNLSTLANSSGKVFVLPTFENTLFKVIGTENGSIILGTFSTSPPAVLVVTPKRAYYFDYENMVAGLPESVTLWNNSVYFFLQRDFRERIYLFKGPAVGYRWSPVGFKEVGPAAPGEYSLVPEKLEINTAPIKVTSKNLSITTEETRWNVTFLKEWYELSVESNPPGADLVIDGVHYGQTPAKAYLTPGTHNLSLIRPGYYAWNAEVNVSKDLNYFANLTPMNGTLIVQSNVNGSVLWINGRRIGYISGTLSISLRPGDYTITVTRRDYRSFTSKVNLAPGEKLELAITLAPLNGTVELSSVPEGADVYVNGNYAGKTPLSLSLRPGKYKITLHLANHSEVGREVTVRANRTVKLNLELTPLNGTLVVNAPANASVYINGKLKGKAPLRLSLQPGEYLVNVTKNGVWNATRVTLGPNSTETVAVSLPKKPSFNWLPAVGLTILLAIGSYFLWRRKTIPPGSEPKTVEGEKFVEVKAGRAFGISHVGARDNNEDNLLVIKLPDAYLLAVADGLGGHNAGEVASKMAVETLKEVFEGYRKGMSDEDVKKLLERAHEGAHERIKKNAVGEREGMGTTLVSAFVRNGKVIVANTGDSRAYLIRDGKITKRTKDHSLVQELVDKGEITAEEAKKHPMRNIITKALGIDFGVDFYEWRLRKGDVLLLSTDGLHDYVDEEKIVEIASSGKTPEEIARKLIEEALPVTKDNVTVVVWKA